MSTARWSRLKPENPTPKGWGEFDDASENEARRFFGEIPFRETEKKYDVDVVRRRPDGQMIETFVRSGVNPDEIGERAVRKGPALTDLSPTEVHADDLHWVSPRRNRRRSRRTPPQPLSP